MRTLIIFLSIIFTTSLLYSQSTIVYDVGTLIDVGTGADVCAGTITVNGTYNGGGTFCSGPLPVELVSFNATAEDNIVELKWKTATEVNNYGFEVERKFGNDQSPVSNFTKIGFVAGNGNSNSPKEYSYEDKSPIGGNKFKYRLKQIDNDGKFEYSDIIEITVLPDKFELSQNYPNPFNPLTKIRLAIPNVLVSGTKQSTNVTLKVYDILGNEVATLVDEEKYAGVYEVSFDASQLSSGIYFYTLQAGSFIETKKMIVLK